jgi:hypothetical protein
VLHQTYQLGLQGKALKKPLFGFVRLAMEANNGNWTLKIHWDVGIAISWRPTVHAFGRVPATHPSGLPQSPRRELL